MRRQQEGWCVQVATGEHIHRDKGIQGKGEERRGESHKGQGWMKSPSCLVPFRLLTPPTEPLVSLAVSLGLGRQGGPHFLPVGQSSQEGDTYTKERGTIPSDHPPGTYTRE